MICAVISDIHANAEALSVVMSSIRALAVDAVYCLGDLVGYNADPESCVRTVLSVATATVRGNHDKAVAGLLDLDWFNPVAREAALWTRSSIPEDLLDRLRRLPQGPLRLKEGVLLCHGTPMDEDAYLYDRGSMQRSFDCLDQEYPQVRICLNGHTHVPLVIERVPGARAPRILGSPQEVGIDPAATYLINPGSVGQPRDGNPLASFGILDTTKLVYRNVRVAYPVRETQRKIGMAGLPLQLASRLADGR